MIIFNADDPGLVSLFVEKSFTGFDQQQRMKDERGKDRLSSMLARFKESIDLRKAGLCDA